jgi:hypothetical protein
MSLGPARKGSGQALAFVAASLATFGGGDPLGAQTVASGPQGDPCAKYRTDDPSRAQCAYNESVRRTKEHEQTGAVARTQAANSGRESACVQSMKSGIANGTFSIEAVRAAYGGRPVRDTSACEILHKLSKS